MGDNQYSGTLPTELGLFTKLEYLFASPIFKTTINFFFSIRSSFFPPGILERIHYQEPFQQPWDN